MGKRRSKRGRSARNAQNSLNNQEPEELVKAPHSFVIYRGHLGKNAKELMINFRKLMEPYTASHLKVQKSNIVNDFVNMAGPLNVTHLIVFTKSETGMYLRIIRLPRGPTLTFQICDYSLARDVISSMKKSVVYDKLFSHHPLLVLNNFSGDGLHFKLMSTMFQGMFPSINVNKANLNTIRRCLLLNYNADKTIEFRHYAVKMVPCGMSKAVKKLIQSKVPDLGHYEDMSEYMMRSGNLSESEAELDGAHNEVILPQPISSRGNITSQKSAIRLYELGPRMKLQLIKIEDGIMTGDVLFHEFIFKTPQEVEEIKARMKQRQQLKEYRRAVQEKNVQKKRNAGEKFDKKEVGEQSNEAVPAPVGKRKRDGSVSSMPSKKPKYSDDKSSNTSTTTGSKGPKTFQDVLARRKNKKKLKQKRQRNKKMSRKILVGKAKHGLTKKK